MKKIVFILEKHFFALWIKLLFSVFQGSRFARQL